MINKLAQRHAQFAFGEVDIVGEAFPEIRAALDGDGLFGQERHQGLAEIGLAVALVVHIHLG